MQKKRVKVLVTGAAGQIGYALIFRIAAGEMFGPQTEVDLHLLELEAALGTLRGVSMELEDCAFPLLKNVICTSDLKEATQGINWALLIGAVPRKAGMERSDLLQINGGLFTEQGKAINNYAAKDVRVLVVGNPCNTNCLIAMHNAPDVPREQFFSMTMLDEKRARSQLAIKAGVDVTAVKHVTIWGNHSSTQYPDFYHAKINGKPAVEVIGDEEWLKTEFIPLIQTRGAEVIKARGSSSAASAANGIIGSVRALIQDTPNDECFSVSTYSTGTYGVDEGLIFSFPTRNRQGKIEVITGLENNKFSQEKIQITLNELRAEKKAVEELKLI